jgi:hypothetical protein
MKNQSTNLTWHRMVLWRRSAVSRSCCQVSPTSISAIFHHNLRLQKTLQTVLVTHLLLKNQTLSVIKFFLILHYLLFLSWDLLNHQLTTKNSHILFWKKMYKKGVQKEKTPLRLLCFILVHSIFELLFGEQDGWLQIHQGFSKGRLSKGSEKLAKNYYAKQLLI